MHTHNEIVTGGNARRGQRGAIAPLAAIMLIMLLSFAALAIDIAYDYIVRNELQNAADAAALAGAAYLYPTIGTPPTPNWDLAKTKADTAVGLNKATKVTLIPGSGDQVTAGYWNFGTLFGTPPSSLQLTSITPGANDFPAIKVTVSKTSGNSNGAVDTFFAKIFGINSVNVGATAVAVGGIGPGSTTENLFPVAVTQCMFNNYWNSTTQQPINDPGTGAPYIFNIGSSYHYSGCDIGQWSTFNMDTTNVPDVRNLIDYADGAQTTNPNPIPLQTGGSTYIEPGTKTTLFDYVNNCSQIAWGTVGSCQYMAVPVVCADPMGTPACGSIYTNTTANITGFACIHILGASGGSTKTITIQMVANGTKVNGQEVCDMSGGGVGKAYGASEPPRLVNYSGNTY